MGDKLIFELEGRQFGLDTSVVYRVLEVDKLFFLPGQSGMVNGIISLMGDPVTVIDCRKALGAPQDNGQRHKIIVVRNNEHLIGFDVGGVNLSFSWEEANKGKTAPMEIEWAALFEEAKKILENQGNHG
ncbi:hypothetical protein EPN18_05385 [bacterium]|nr:MAG: hypothetical protein EPN18_05385 [bacterium]